MPIPDSSPKEAATTERYAKLNDHELWCQVLDDAAWLFYGDLDEHFQTFVARVFDNLEAPVERGAHPSFGGWGFSGPLRDTMTPDFSVAYWLFVGELIRLDLADYGTSPRSAWLTDDGVRFRNEFARLAALGPIDWSPERV